MEVWESCWEPWRPMRCFNRLRDALPVRPRGQMLVLVLVLVLGARCSCARLGLLPRLLQHGVRGAVRSHLARRDCTLLGSCGRVCRCRRWRCSGVRWSR